MKKVLLLAFVLGSFNVLAEDNPVVGQADASTIDCSKIFAGKAAAKPATDTDQPAQPAQGSSKPR